jgi:hypothetical protein
MILPLHFIRIIPKGLSLVLVTLLLLTSCEDPSLSQVGKKVESAPPASAAPVSDAPVAESAPDKAAESGAQIPAAPVASTDASATEQGPELTLQWRGEEIVISGAIRSRLQRDRIGEEMGLAFSGTRVVNELEVDTNRIAVGWGNRITEDLLIFYFKEIDKAFFSYKDGIITLGGQTKQANLIRQFQELTVGVVSGELSRDIVNKIEVLP